MNENEATGADIFDMLEKSKGIDAGRIWAKQASVSDHSQMPTGTWSYLKFCFQDDT